jgi:hypothetical protein
MGGWMGMGVLGRGVDAVMRVSRHFPWRAIDFRLTSYYVTTRHKQTGTIFTALTQAWFIQHYDGMTARCVCSPFERADFGVGCGSVRLSHVDPLRIEICIDCDGDPSLCHSFMTCVTLQHWAGPLGGHQQGPLGGVRQRRARMRGGADACAGAAAFWQIRGEGGGGGAWCDIGR